MRLGSNVYGSETLWLSTGRWVDKFRILGGYFRDMGGEVRQSPDVWLSMRMSAWAGRAPACLWVESSHLTIINK